MDFWKLLNLNREMFAKSLTEDSQGENLGGYCTDDTIVEEIVRRNGKFYTAVKANPLLPDYARIPYNDVFAAKCERDDYPIPWVFLNIVQYHYGLYLKNLVDTGELKVEDIKR